MEGKYVPAGQRRVRMQDGTLGYKVETLLEDEIIARWEAKQFTSEEKIWASQWRRRTRNIFPNIYLEKIKALGINFIIPENADKLVRFVDSVLLEKKIQGMLLFFLFREHDVPLEMQKKVSQRWFAQGSPFIKDFAPYAFFCVRALLLLAIGLTNSQIFKQNKHNRRDLEYCYYLPHCQVFSSTDDLQKTLVPLIIRPDQDFIEGTILKKELRAYIEKSDEESFPTINKIQTKQRQIRDSFAVRKKTDEKIDEGRPINKEYEGLTFEEFLKAMSKKVEEAQETSFEEVQGPKNSGKDEPLFLQRKIKMSKERLMKMYPHIDPSVFDKKD